MRSLFGTLVAETILASVHVRAPKQAGHMDASDLIKALQNTLQGGGRPHMENQLFFGRRDVHATFHFGVSLPDHKQRCIFWNRPEQCIYFTVSTIQISFNKWAN